MLDWLLIVIVTAMVLVLIRATKGPGWFNRVLAINAFGTLTVLLLALISITSGVYSLMDIALLYVLINFTLTVAILRFFTRKNVSIPEQGKDA